MKELKKYYCKICKRELIPKHRLIKKYGRLLGLPKSVEPYRICIHHIDYQQNIAIRVCPDCHLKLHTTMKNYKYGLNNIVREDGTKKGSLYPGRYPKKIIE
jgi:hypothetical protein